MNLELKKRIQTSSILLLLFFIMMISHFVLLYILIIGSVLIWLEFSNLNSKIFKRNNYLNFLSNLLFLIYISLFSSALFILFLNTSTKAFLIFTIFICILTDIGGLVFGRFFKGKKLTTISPNKTVWGAVGSLFFSILFLLFFFFMGFVSINLHIILFVLITSMSSQIGDIFISFLKRKAKVKDTGKLLPGHGGLLDRVDGILLGVPVGVFTFYILS